FKVQRNSCKTLNGPHMPSKVHLRACNNGPRSQPECNEVRPVADILHSLVTDATDTLQKQVQFLK
ncbi:MAG: hypothetical protein AAF525_17090, partial [Pseudomonadota bacterium]